MASEIKANKFSPATGTTITMGDSGDTFSVPSGVTLNVASGGTLSGNVYSGLLGVQYYTSNSTWTKSTRETAVGGTILYVEVQVIGGGGSGNETVTANDKGAGGGAGYCKKFIDVSAITSSTVTVGAGGAGTGTATGNAGNPSSWSDGTNTLTANGGGAGTTGTGGTGGTATGGDINLTGSSGRVGGTRGFPGQAFGGLSLFGEANTGTNGVDVPGLGYGTGSGAVETADSVAGQDGIVIVHEYGYKT